MNKQQIVTSLINDFELRSLEIIQDNPEHWENQRGIVKTLRASNQTEIRILITKYKNQSTPRFKRLFHELLERALEFISEEANNYFQKEHSQLFRLYAEIESLKKYVHEKENKITDLVLDNFRLQSIISTLPEQEEFDKLIANYNKDLIAMQQEIESKKFIIAEYEVLQEASNKKVNDLEQQIFELRNQSINPAVALSENPQKTSFLPISTLNQIDSADFIYDDINLMMKKSETLNHSTEICSRSNQQISIRSKSICTNREEINPEGKGRKNRTKVVLPQMAGKTHYPLRSKTPIPNSQMIDLKSLLANFEKKNPKKMDNIYLFSKARRRSQNADVYYEPPLYRFNLKAVSK